MNFDAKNRPVEKLFLCEAALSLQTRITRIVGIETRITGVVTNLIAVG